MNQEPIKPDYNYILNQQDDNAPKPRKSKATYVAFGAVVVLVITTFFAFTFNALNNSVSNSSSATVARSHQEAAQLFVDSMKKKDYSAIVKDQLAQSLTHQEEGVNIFLLRRLASGTELTTCSKGESTANNDGTFTSVYVCNSANDDSRNKMIVITKGVGGGFKVSGHRVEDA